MDTEVNHDEKIMSEETIKDVNKKTRGRPKKNEFLKKEYDELTSQIVENFKIIDKKNKRFVLHSIINLY